MGPMKARHMRYIHAKQDFNIYYSIVSLMEDTNVFCKRALSASKLSAKARGYAIIIQKSG